MNSIIYITVAMLLITSVSAATQTSTNFQLHSFYGTGGVSDSTLTQLNSNVSFGFSQFIIGNRTATFREADLGLYYIATLALVSPIIPPVVIPQFIFFIKEIGLEYIKLNWTR